MRGILFYVAVFLKKKNMMGLLKSRKGGRLHTGAERTQHVASCDTTCCVPHKNVLCSS